MGGEKEYCAILEGLKRLIQHFLQYSLHVAA